MVFLTKILKTVQVHKSFRPVSHVIFDIDGLLLHTEDIYHKIDATIINKYGQDYPWDVRLKVLGRTEQECAEIIVKECKLPISAEKFRAEVQELQRSLLKEATLLPGAERLVRHFSDHKVPIACATSSGVESVIAKTTNYKELFDLFHHIVIGSSDNEVKKGKPAPDIFLIAASRFVDNPNPSKCLVFEDAPNGVQAAVDAGMQVVMVPDSRIHEDDTKNATLVLNELSEFQPQLFGLPNFK